MLCPPDHFRIDDPRNPFSGTRGAPNRIDPARARQQWEALKEACVDAGLEVRVARPSPELPDQVFTANPVLAGPGRRVLASRMTYPEREGEVGPLLDALGDHEGLGPLAEGPYEGGGDMLWHGGTLLAGHGFRSTEAAGRAAAAAFGVPGVSLKLVDERFYHLDTALCVLGDAACLWVPGAFDAEGRSAIETRFPRRFAVPEAEALRLAANAFHVDGRVLIEADTPATQAWLKEEGYDVVALDTSEFRKSGGSVYCMKQAFGGP